MYKRQPKLRIGEIKDGVILENDADVYITNEEILGDANRFTLKYENFTDFREGDQVLIDDGKIVLSIEKVLSAKEMKAKVIRGGPLLSRKGFNVPNANLSIFPVSYTHLDVYKRQVDMVYKIYLVAMLVELLLVVRYLLLSSRKGYIDLIKKSLLL